MIPFSRFTPFLIIIVTAFSCAGATARATAGPRNGPIAGEATPSVRDHLKKPALIAVDPLTGGLEYWKVEPKGSDSPKRLSAPLADPPSALVANGDIIIGAAQNPPGVVFYNVKTKSQSTLSDPYGTPVELAIGKDGSVYVMNVAHPSGNVAYYPKGSDQVQELACKDIYLGEAVAVDNEGDIFVQGYSHGNFTGVVEIPNGPSGPEPAKCHKLHLVSEDGTYTAGVAVDPKTDDLITLDNPSLCAGGEEGRMIIYPKPYSSQTAQVVVLGGNCTDGLRLNRDSTMVFYGDESVGDEYTYIDAAAYPSGMSMGIYSFQASDYGPGGFTTIPNSLPN